MTITNGYISADELSEWLQITDYHDDLDRVINSTSRSIDRFCGRYFYQDSAVSAHEFDGGGTVLRVRDISTATGLVVKTVTTDGTTFSTTWAAGDYRLEPYAGIVDGLTGFPYTHIIGVDRTFPYGTRPQVQVTAKWGWAAVPDAVAQACLIKAARVFKRRNTPHGINTGEFGAIRITNQQDPDVTDLLAPYRLAGSGAGLVVG